MRHHLVTVAFLVGAAVLYALGAGLSAVVLVGLGAVAEGVFWFRLIRGWRGHRNRS